MKCKRRIAVLFALAQASGFSAVPELLLTPDVPVSSAAFSTNDGRLPGHSISVETTWTNDGVVVRLCECLTEGRSLKMSATPDRPVSMFELGDSTMEVFLRPDPLRPENEYQVSVNPSNVVYAARNHKPWKEFAIPVRTMVRITDSGWCTEFFLPFGAFGETVPKAGESRDIEFAVGPYRWRSGRELSYGRLVFGDRTSLVRIESLTEDPDGVVHIGYAIGQRNRKRTRTHKRLTAPDVALVLDGGRIEASYSPVSFDCDAGWITLDRYYYECGDVCLGYSYRASDYDDPVVSVRSIRTGHVVFSGALADRGELLLPGLRPDEYAFEVSDCSGRSGCQFEVIEKWDSLGEPIPQTIRIENTTLFADFVGGVNRPLFLVTGSQDVLGTIRFVPALAAKYWKHDDLLYYRYPSNLQLYGAVDYLRDYRHPYEIARIAYEAQIPVALKDGGDGVSEFVSDCPLFYRNCYRELKRKFPSRLFSIHVDNLSVARDYAPCCDILEVSLPYEPNPLVGLKELMNRIVSDARGRPVVLWVGASLPDNGKYRTADELNTLARYAVLRGAMGCVWHLGHGSVPKENKRLWSFIRGCEKSVQTWYPEWVRAKPLEACCHGESGIEAETRILDGRQIVVAVNLSPGERGFEYWDVPQQMQRNVVLTGFGSVVIQSGN